MAQGATVYVFDIQLANADRNVFEALSLRVAQHPSETPEYMLTRVLAYCLEYTPGIVFSTGGLSAPDEPALSVRDLTGALQTWIEVGAPDAARLHKASKAAKRVVVYAHKQVNLLLDKLKGEKIHRSETIEIMAIDADLLSALCARLNRRMSFSLAISDGQLYLTLGEDTYAGTLIRHHIGE